MEYDLIKKDASNTLTADQINFATRNTVQIVTNAISTMMLLTACVQRNVLHYVKINHIQSKESVHYVMREWEFSVLKDMKWLWQCHIHMTTPSLQTKFQQKKKQLKAQQLIFMDYQNKMFK